jgi:hypothetical protein
MFLCFRRKTTPPRIPEPNGDNHKQIEKAWRKVEKYYREQALSVSAVPSQPSQPSQPSLQLQPPKVPLFNGTNHNQVAIAMAKLQEYYKEQKAHERSQMTPEECMKLEKERASQRQIQVKKELELRERTRLDNERSMHGRSRDRATAGVKSYDGSSGSSGSSGNCSAPRSDDHLSNAFGALCLGPGSLSRETLYE